MPQKTHHRAQTLNLRSIPSIRPRQAEPNEKKIPIRGRASRQRTTTDGTRRGSPQNAHAKQQRLRPNTHPGLENNRNLPRGMGLRRQTTQRKTKRGPDTRGPTCSDHQASPNKTHSKIQTVRHKGRDHKNTQQRKKYHKQRIPQTPALGQLGSRHAPTQRCNPNKQHHPTPYKRPANNRART